MILHSIKNYICSATEYLIILCIVLEFNTVYIEFPLVKDFVVYSLLLFLFTKLLFQRDFKLYPITIIVASGAFVFLFNWHGSISSFFFMYIIFLPLTISWFIMRLKKEKDGQNNILYKLSNIICVIAVISLFFWLVGSNLYLIDYTGLIPVKWGGDRFIPTYYGLYFETQDINSPFSPTEVIVRNSGIFSEAPMFNMALCVALSIEMFLRKKKRNVIISMLVLAILTTFSTTGFFFLLFLFLVRYSSTKKRLNLKSIIIFTIVMIISVSISNLLLANKKETGESSFTSRLYDIQRCIEVGLDNPFLGVGLFSVGKEESSGLSKFGFSNSLFTIFAHGGFYALLLYVYPLLFSPLSAYFKGNRTWALISICYFVLFVFTVCLYRYLTLFIMAYSIAHRSISNSWIKRTYK